MPSMQIPRTVAIAILAVAVAAAAALGFFAWQASSPSSTPTAVDGVAVAPTTPADASPSPSPSASTVPGEVVPVPLPDAGTCRSALDDVKLIVDQNPQVLQIPPEGLEVFSERLGYARQACAQEFGPQVSEGIMRQFHDEVLKEWLAGGPPEES